VSGQKKGETIKEKKIEKTTEDEKMEIKGTKRRRYKREKLEEYEGREGGEDKKEKGEGIKEENDNTKEGNVQRTRKKREKA
jgi:hypothetical protein